MKYLKKLNTKLFHFFTETKYEDLSNNREQEIAYVWQKKMMFFEKISCRFFQKHLTISYGASGTKR